MDEFGLNVISEKYKVSKLRIFLSQFKSSVVWVLLAAMIVTFLLNDLIDFYVIVVVVIINSIFGFWQEYKAENAIAALKKMISLKAVVIRDHAEQEIDASQLVPGDIVLVNTGQKIPADGRIISALNLSVEQAALTGESISVQEGNGRKFMTPNEGPNSKGSIDADIKSKYKTGFKFPEGRKIIRSEYRNNPIQPLAYGALTGEENAMRYAEGENNDYTNLRRVMNELAGFCHICDILSARVFHNYPRRDMPGLGQAQRINGDLSNFHLPDLSLS